MKKYLVIICLYTQIQFTIFGMENSEKVIKPIKPPQPLAPINTTRKQKNNKPLTVGDSNLYYEKKKAPPRPKNIPVAIKACMSSQKNKSQKDVPVSNNVSEKSQILIPNDTPDSIVLHDLSILDIDPEEDLPDDNSTDLQAMISNLKNFFFPPTEN